MQHRKLELIKLGTAKNYAEFFDCIGAVSLLVRNYMPANAVDENLNQCMNTIDKMVRAVARAVLVDVELH